MKNYEQNISFYFHIIYIEIYIANYQNLDDVQQFETHFRTIDPNLSIAKIYVDFLFNQIVSLILQVKW